MRDLVRDLPITSQCFRCHGTIQSYQGTLVQRLIMVNLITLRFIYIQSN